MNTEQTQDQATLYALGVLNEAESRQFVVRVRENVELREFLWSVQRILERMILTGAVALPPPGLFERVLQRIQAQQEETLSSEQQLSAAAAGLKFVSGTQTSGWKQLPFPGAWIKLLSFERSRGYAVLLGKLEAGARYPAHINAGPEDFYILTGDLHVSERVLGPGDFHHADAGSHHSENYSLAGCTLLAILTVDDPLVSFAME